MTDAAERGFKSEHSKKLLLGERTSSISARDERSLLKRKNREYGRYPLR